MSLFSYSAMGGEIGSASEGDGGSWSGQSYSGSDSDGANSGNSANWSESAQGNYNNGSWSLASYVLQGTSTDYMSSHAYETVWSPVGGGGGTGASSDTFFRHDTTSSQLTCSYYQSGAMAAGNYANSSYSVNETAAVAVTFKIPGDSNNWNVSATLQGNLAGATIGTTTSYSFTRQAVNASGSGTSSGLYTWTWSVPGLGLSLAPPDSSMVPVLGTDGASGPMGVSSPNQGQVEATSEQLSANIQTAQEAIQPNNGRPMVPPSPGSSPTQSPVPVVYIEGRNSASASLQPYNPASGGPAVQLAAASAAADPPPQAPAVDDGSNLQWISQDKMKDLERNNLVHTVREGGENYRVIITVVGNEIRAFVYTEVVNPAKGGEREWALARSYGMGLINKPGDVDRMLKNADTDETAKRLAKATSWEALHGANLNGLNILVVGLTLLPGGGSADAILRGDYVDATIYFVGDISLWGGLWVKWAAEAAALRGGAKAASTVAKANKVLVSFQVAQGAIVVIRVGQGGYAVAKDENGKAVIYFGEAILRIFGVAYVRKVAPKNVPIPKGEVGKYTTKIKWGIQDVDARPAGPGYWGKRIKQKPAVDAYELKINPNNESYYLPHPDGGYVQFENVVETTLQDGKLVKTAKSFYRPSKLGKTMQPIAEKQILAEAQRQLEAAGAHSMQVEWLVSDADAAKELAALFKAKGINIKVTHFPE